MNISKKRQRLNELFKEHNKLKKSFMIKGPIKKGGVYKAKTKCGNPNCRCMTKGELHEVWRYYYSESGKNKVKTIKESEVSEYKKLTSRYKKFRQARMRLVKLQKKILNLINSIEEDLKKDDQK